MDARLFEAVAATPDTPITHLHARQQVIHGTGNYPHTSKWALLNGLENNSTPDCACVY